MRHADKEVSNKLWNSFAHRPDRNLKNSVDACSNLFHEDVRTTSVGLLRLRLWLNKHTVLVVLRSFNFLLRHDRSAIIFVICVVDEQVVLLRVDDSFDKFTGVVTLSLKNLDDYVHDLWANTRASHENTLDDSGGESLKLCVAVLNQLESRVAKLVELGRNQILEDIYGREARNGVTLMHGNCTLDRHIRVLLGRVKVLEVGVKPIELHLNL